MKSHWIALVTNKECKAAKEKAIRNKNLSNMNLIEQCKQAIERDICKDGKPRITVVLKGKWTKSGKKKLFNLPQAPKGDIFADHSEGKLVVSFDAKEVLAYCEQLVPVMLSIEEQRQAKSPDV